jgi:hypothetical protein
MNAKLKMIVKSLKRMLKQLPEFSGSIKCQERNGKIVLDIGSGGASLMFSFAQGGIYDPINYNVRIVSLYGVTNIENGVIEETNYKSAWMITLELLEMMAPHISDFLR